MAPFEDSAMLVDEFVRRAIISDGTRSGAGRRKEEEEGDVGFGKLESRNNVLQNRP